MTKAALYIRTSTNNQKESITLQTEELERYCKLHEIEIHDKYIDFGLSGKNTERPAFQHLMQEAADDKFNLVLVTKIDRFARSIVDCLVNVQKLENIGIQFAATSQPFDTSDAMGKLMLAQMAAFADFERTIIRERMENGRKAAEKRGVICHRPRVQVSKAAVEGYLAKGLSANAISKILEVDGKTITGRLLEWGYSYEYGEWKQ